MPDPIGMGEDFLKQIAGYVAREQQGAMAGTKIKLGSIDYDYSAPDFLGGINPRVLFDGETVVSQKRYNVIPPYYPIPGDRVVLVPIGTTYAIIGTVGNVTLQPKIERFTSNGTWVKPVGARYVRIECQGAGGGGGGAASTGGGDSSMGGGGGGGAYGVLTLTANALDDTVGVFVGTGGAGGTGNASGSAGGGSSFGSSLSADGGFGGGSFPAGSTSQGTFGGDGNTTTGGDPGPDATAGGTGGGAAWRTGARCISGAGGASHLGGGGAGQHTNGTESIAGKAGKVFGGGGGGAVASAGGGSNTGGAGANGVVVVTTYFN